jgi:hypothetical protein
VRRFRLNDAQARPAAHVASWLPGLAAQPSTAQRPGLQLQRAGGRAAAPNPAGKGLPAQPPVS